MGFWQRMNNAVAVGVFIVSSCAERRSKPVTPAPSLPQSELASSGVAAPWETGYATFYASSLSGRKTANGERYDPSQLTAAHRTLPFGTMVEVRRIDGDGRSVVVRVNDRGPFTRDRIIDLSRRAAEELGIVHEGKAVVELRPARPDR